MKRIVVALAVLAIAGAASAKPYDVVEKDIATLQADLAAGRVTSVELVQAYIKRIEAIDRHGPALHSVIALNPHALADARALDAERKTKGARGPLHGIPILVKDNIETADPMPTTAGSLALKTNFNGRDATAIARLRAAGVVVLGKANLSEWANIRSSHSISGWSGIGGLVKNPYVLDRSACGSSSGSGAAVSASLAAAAIGSETDGSLVCPGSLNGVVALKPTIGLVSRTHIIPISHSQDTAGPMARTTADAALLLTVMAGSDADDTATASSDQHKSDYASALAGASLEGRRLGVIAPAPDAVPGETDAVFLATLSSLKQQGAEIVEIKDFTPPPPEASADELIVLEFELKSDLNAYLATTRQTLKTLDDVIAFNRTTPRETVLFGQDIFETANSTTNLSDPVYVKARDALKASSRAALDGLFAKYKLDALIRATDDAAFRIDTIKGDNDSSSASFLPATAGYPHITVPMGFVHGLPVGLSFMGPVWSEASLLAMAHTFEQATHARKPPQFVKSLEATPEEQRAFAPE
jgi:amidase